MNEVSAERQAERVRQYYNEWQGRYSDIYGPIIQACRPSDDKALLSYLARSIGIERGEHILDAGCGTAGPALYFAKHIECKVSGITISEKQAGIAQADIAKSGLQDRVQVLIADYHQLSSIFPLARFDKVVFLESLGHAGDASRVIKEAFDVLRHGGRVYIKDFYRNIPNDPIMRRKVDDVISRINTLYAYNTLDLNETLSALRGAGFEIDYIRRFEFKQDISIPKEFEAKFGIDLFGGKHEFAPAEWLEIRCIKP